MDNVDIVRSSLSEAIQKLGLIKPDALERIVHLLSAEMSVHPRQTCAEYRKTGVQLTKEEKKSLGINGNAFFSREAFDDLTELGRKNPISAHQQTVLRANFTVGRYQTIQHLKQLQRDNEWYKGLVKFSSSSRDCPVCNDLDETVIEIDQAPIFPPANCVCHPPSYIFVAEVDWLSGWNEPDEPENQSLFSKIKSWFVQKS